MAVLWHKTNFLGVRYREHATRKHGVRFDRCFSIRYKINGKDKEEVAGWGSEGMTAEKAFSLLSTIRENIRLGVEPRSVAAMRFANERKEEEENRVRLRVEKESFTFAEFWEAEYQPGAETTKTPKSLQTEIGFYKNWIYKAIGDIPLQQIDVPKVEALTHYALKAGKSPQTVRHIVGIVSRVWNKAWARGYVQGDNPTRRVKKPRQDSRRMRFLAIDEARLLLEALALRSMDTHDEALLALFCGLRAGEIHALIWGDVDIQNGIILIRDPKNTINRHAFIVEEVRAMLERRFTQQTKNEYIFPAANGKQRQWIPETFNRVIDTLGLNDSGEFSVNSKGEQVPVKIKDRRQRIVFHTLRHTFASWLVQRGEPLYTVAKLMGHNSLEMTQRYSHLAPDTLRKAAKSLEGSLSARNATVIPFSRKNA